MEAKMAISWSCSFHRAAGSSLRISLDQDPDSELDDEEESEDPEDQHWVASVESRR